MQNIVPCSALHILNRRAHRVAVFVLNWLLLARACFEGPMGSFGASAAMDESECGDGVVTFLVYGLSGIFQGFSTIFLGFSWIVKDYHFNS